MGGDLCEGGTGEWAAGGDAAGAVAGDDFKSGASLEYGQGSTHFVADGAVEGKEFRAALNEEIVKPSDYGVE